MVIVDLDAIVVMLDAIIVELDAIVTRSGRDCRRARHYCRKAGRCCRGVRRWRPEFGQSRPDLGRHRRECWMPSSGIWSPVMTTDITPDITDRRSRHRLDRPLRSRRAGRYRCSRSMTTRKPMLKPRSRGSCVYRRRFEHCRRRNTSFPRG